MLHTLKLLIPALIPSWRFFDAIAPSPRIQFTLLTADDEVPHEWHEFRPRPAHLSFPCMLGRMLWNPQWNETLFVVSCAERLMEYPTRHSEHEILKRIIGDIVREPVNAACATATHLQFRLLTLERREGGLHEEVTYHSRVVSLPGQGFT